MTYLNLILSFVNHSDLAGISNFELNSRNPSTTTHFLFPPTHFGNASRAFLMRFLFRAESRLTLRFYARFHASFTNIGSLILENDTFIVFCGSPSSSIKYFNSISRLNILSQVNKMSHYHHSNICL